MRILILILLVGCVHSAAPATPAFANRVCLIAHEIEPSGVCNDLGRGAGTNHVDVAIWRSSGGVKLCMETFDAKQPLACSPLVLSPAELAQQTLAQERAKQAAATPPPAPPAPATPPAPPLVTPPTKAPKKP